ncbi:MAG: LPS translocon maturation chaperone LptM [Halochromatium sp.]
MHCWARSLLYLLISVLGFGQMMVACGQRGSLYLPDAESDMANSAANRAVSTPASGASHEGGREAGDEVPAVPSPSGAF